MRSLLHPLATSALISLTALLGGCASVQAPVPPSLELPKPPTDLRAIRKGDRVYLSWSVPAQTVDNQNVRSQGPTRICRGLEALMSSCATPVGNAPPAGKPRPQPSTPFPQDGFVDTLPRELQQQNPGRMITYAVEALNRQARSAGLSNQVQVSLAPTLAAPANFRAEVKPDGVELTWDCAATDSQPDLHFLYRIYRSSGAGVDVRLADVTCPGGHYEDRTVEWEKSYEYRITVVTEAALAGASPSQECQNANASCPQLATVEGDDSPPQKIFTHDIYPPGVPSGLQAVFSGPGQAAFIDLLWAPDTDADLAGYNVYRRETSGQPVKLNPELVKTPAFRDANVASGKTYFYSVAAVDERGNESARSEETSETVP